MGRESGVHIGREANIEVWELVRILENVDESPVARHADAGRKLDTRTAYAGRRRNLSVPQWRVAVSATDWHGGFTSFGPPSRLTPLRRGILRVARRAEAHASAFDSRERRMVAQIFPRWNPLTSWMRQIEDFQRAA